MRQIKLFKTFMLCFLLGYPLLVTAEYAWRKSPEFFPFARWNMYSTIPLDRASYALEILDPETPDNLKSSLLRSSRTNGTIGTTVKRLGQSIERNDAVAAAHYRHSLGRILRMRGIKEFALFREVRTLDANKQVVYERRKRLL